MIRVLQQLAVTYVSKDDRAPKEGSMSVLGKQSMALYVDRSCPQWIVRDAEGNFWILPSVADAWDHRQPFQPTAETDLEPVPGHYKDMLGVPL